MSEVITVQSNAFVSRYHVNPEHKAKFVAAFDALWRSAREFMNEQCNFVFYGWDRDGRVFYAIESWKNDEVTQGLRNSDAFKEQVGQLMDYCDAPMEMELAQGIECSDSIFKDYPQGPSQVHPSGKNGLGTVFL
jgi:quinol monooxygenase YgiN